MARQPRSLSAVDCHRLLIDQYLVSLCPRLPADMGQRVKRRTVQDRAIDGKSRLAGGACRRVTRCVARADELLPYGVEVDRAAKVRTAGCQYFELAAHSHNEGSRGDVARPVVAAAVSHHEARTGDRRNREHLTVSKVRQRPAHADRRQLGPGRL